jgi:hypothetical protein
MRCSTCSTSPAAGTCRFRPPRRRGRAGASHDPVKPGPGARSQVNRDGHRVKLKGSTTQTAAGFPSGSAPGSQRQPRIVSQVAHATCRDMPGVRTSKAAGVPPARTANRTVIRSGTSRLGGTPVPEVQDGRGARQPGPASRTSTGGGAPIPRHR